MDTANAAEKQRNSEVDAEQKSNVWRGVKPSGVFWNTKSLAQDNKDYPEWVDQYNGKTTDTAAA